MIVSRETEKRLNIFQSLIEKWNPHINLVAPASLPDIYERHIVDCLQVIELGPFVAGKWCDLGSGGGLPGIVLAAALEHLDMQFTLIESDQRKAVFLRTASREMGLRNVTVLNHRIETAAPQNAENISARALAPLVEIMPHLVRHMRPDGKAWLFKGENWEKEVETANSHWSFSYDAQPSQTRAGATILKLYGIIRCNRLA